MITSVVIDNRSYTFEKEDVIGRGGEALIFKLPKFENIAVKVYRQPTREREDKLHDFFRGNFALPPNVFAPLEPVHTHRGDVVGFTMKKLEDGCNPIAVLGNRTYCAQNGITTKTVVNIFCGMHGSLLGIHRTGIIVGDLNDRNEVLGPDHQKEAWIDVDSWQWGLHPCMVGTEAFLSPDLYRVDLSKQPYFKEEHDWFSFVVILFRSLLRVHPFRAGIHPQYKSLMARAEKGITVLDPDVNYPAIGLSPDILSDDLTSLLIDYLKRGQRDPFPFDALWQYRDILIECPSCHLWYAGTRKNCPGCQTKNIMDMRLKQVFAGCDSEVLITTTGKIIFFKIVGATLYCLADEAGTTVLYKKPKDDKVERKEVFKTRPGARFGLFEENLAICLNPVSEKPELLVVDISGPQPRPVLKTVTRPIAGGKAVFSCSSKYLYRIVGLRIMRGNIFDDSNQLLEREVIQSLQGQTWFTVSPNPTGSEFLTGFHRIFGDLRWFLVRSDEASFQRFEVDLPQLTIGESLIDLSIKFSDTSVLIIRKTRKDGIDYVRIDVVSGEDGNVAHSHTGKVEDLEHYENIHGKAFKTGVVMHPTDKGIVQEKIANQQTKVLADSDQFVTGSDALHAYGNGVLVVTGDRVLLVKPKERR